jgi:hypothetical protein
MSIAAQIAAAVLLAVFTKSFSVRLGPGTLTASDTTGAPQKLTVALILKAASMAYGGQTAFIQSGNVKLTYTV